MVHDGTGQAEGTDGIISAKFFKWYEKNKDKLQKLDLGDMKKFLKEHPEKKMAYYFKLFDS